VATLTYGFRLIPDIHETLPVHEHFVAILSGDGELLEEISLLELVRAAPEVLRLETVRKRRSRGSEEEVDLLHANSIEWMPHPALSGTHPLYAPHHALVTLRHQNAVALLDLEAKKLIWAWGPGEISGPHDATLLPNGNVLIFDNGLSRRWSRVVEVDPRTDRLVWEYAPEPREDF
jgi:hypothetical protein